ncbi:MAG: hypothetical protein IJO93_04770 [Clostridia bacterium]|nr:hypothetical protein [Clostridia bacterium]
MKKTAIIIAALLLLTITFNTFAERMTSSGTAEYTSSGDDISQMGGLSGDAESGSDESDSKTEGELLYVINPEFDDVRDGSVLPEGWELDSYAENGTYMEVVTDGEDENCLHLVCNEENDARAIQTVSCKPDTYYMISCMVKAKNIEGGAGANVSVMGIRDASTDGIFHADEWHEVKLTGKTGVDQSVFTIALRIGGYSAMSGGEAWFDSVCVRELSYTPVGYVNFFSASTKQDDAKDDNTGYTQKDEGAMPYFAEMMIAIVASTLALVLLYVLFFGKHKDVHYSGNYDPKFTIVIILLCALLVRVLANFIFTSLEGQYGHSTDIKCFMAWGYKVASSGPANFYSEGYFADYPPGYMWILGGCEKLRLLLGFEYGSAAHAFVMKLPSVICDLTVTYLVYHIARNTGRSTRSAVIISCLAAFNPALIMVSAVWGQIDIMLTLFIVLTFMWLASGISCGIAANSVEEKRKSIVDITLSGLFYGIAVALKPQALMVGPLFAAAHILYFVTCICKHKASQSVISTALAAICAFAVIILPSIPFTGTQEGFWLMDKYMGTATSYNYATVEAYNLYTLFGANWKDADLPFIFGLTYKQFGTSCMVLMVSVSIILYALADKNKKGLLMLTAAFSLSGIFAFGHFMHERYLLPVLILVLIAMLYYNDKRLYLVYGGFSVSLLYNLMGAFLITDYYPARVGDYPAFMTVGAIMTLVVFVWFAYVTLSIILGKNNENKNQLFYPLPMPKSEKAK